MKKLPLLLAMEKIRRIKPPVRVICTCSVCTKGITEAHADGMRLPLVRDLRAHPLCFYEPERHRVRAL